LSNLVYIWTDSKFGKITVTPCDVVKLQSIVFAKITVAHNDSVNLTVNPNTELLDLKERNNLNPLNLNPIALKRCNDYRAVWSKCKIQLDPLVLRSNSSCAAIVEDMTTITRTVIQFHIQQNASPISNKCTEAVGIAQYPNTQWKL
jgi:hypothetical protein